METVYKDQVRCNALPCLRTIMIFLQYSLILSSFAHASYKENRFADMYQCVLQINTDDILFLKPFSMMIQGACKHCCKRNSSVPTKVTVSDKYESA